MHPARVWKLICKWETGRRGTGQISTCVGALRAAYFVLAWKFSSGQTTGAAASRAIEAKPSG